MASSPPNCKTGFRTNMTVICLGSISATFIDWVHTVLSSPSVIIITKKMMAKKVEPIMFAMASG